MIVDTHTHVASTDTERFPLAPTGATADWWAHGGSVDELLATHDANGVERVVVVQAIGAYGYDCTYASASVGAHRDRAALVVAVDMNGDDPAADLAALLATPLSGVRPAGVRIFGVGTTSADWTTDGRGAAVIDVAADDGLVVVPTLLADRFGALADLAARRPDAVMAVDHCGFPDLCDHDVVESWRRLVDHPGVHMKVTSYVFEGAERDDHDPAPITERLVELFGVDRLCWGSDHPQDTRSDYTGKLALARHATRALDDDARDAFFGRTGLRLFF